MSTASGGQIVVSAATQALVGRVGALAVLGAGDDDVTDISFRDLGLHRLKDIEDPEHLYECARRAWPISTDPCAASVWLPTCPRTAPSWWAGSTRWPSSSRSSPSTALGW